MIRPFASPLSGLALALLLTVAPVRAQVVALHLAPPPADTTAVVRINAAQARRYLGRRVTVTANVVRAYTASSKEGSPTFLNLARPWPDCPLEIVVFADLTARLSRIPAGLVGRAITVTGKVIRCGKAIQIVPTDARQLTLSD